MTYLEKIADYNSLWISFQNYIKNGVLWKEDVQKINHNLLPTIIELHDEILNGTYERRPFREFIIKERGKERLVKASDIRDRIVDGSICENMLIPELHHHCIYDNCANIKGKGISETRRRLTKHLAEFYKEHKTEGYILLIDFQKYFDNIDHFKIIENLDKIILDKSAFPLLWKEIDACKIDVSFLTDQQYEKFKDDENFRNSNHGALACGPGCDSGRSNLRYI